MADIVPADAEINAGRTLLRWRTRPEEQASVGVLLTTAAGHRIEGTPSSSGRVRRGLIQVAYKQRPRASSPTGASMTLLVGLESSTALGPGRGRFSMRL